MSISRILTEFIIAFFEDIYCSWLFNFLWDRVKTLKLKKLFLILVLEFCITKFKGSLAILVTLLWLIFLNHVAGLTSLNPWIILNVWIMSARSRLSSSESNFSSISFSVYVFPISPDIIRTALFWTSSKQLESASVQGDQAAVQNSRWGRT